MNEKNLRTLFEDALSGEPAEMAPVQDDLVRGRALRARRIRRRAGGAGAAAGLVVAALVVPASPLALIDGGADPSGTAAASGGAALTPDVADDPVLRALWEAVEGALPGDVRVPENSAVRTRGYGSGLWFTLQRGEDETNMSVLVENAIPALDHFSPCENPDPDLAPPLDGSECTEGYDAEGQWRVYTESPDASRGTLLLEDDAVTVLVDWYQSSFSVDENGEVDDTGSILTSAELDGVAGAALAAAADGPIALTGVDLTAAVSAWPDVRVSLEEILDLGPLTPVAPEDVSDDAVYDPETGALADIDDERQSGTVAARYATTDGSEVDVLLWQKSRLYDTFCHDRLDHCETLPGLSVERVVPAPDALVGPGVHGQLGDRSGLYVKVGTGEMTHPDNPESMELEAKVSAAQVSLSRMVPFLGPNTFPIPDGI